MKVVKLFFTYMKKVNFCLWFLVGVRIFGEIKLSQEVKTPLENETNLRPELGWYVAPGSL